MVLSPRRSALCKGFGYFETAPSRLSRCSAWLARFILLCAVFGLFPLLAASVAVAGPRSATEKRDSPPRRLKGMDIDGNVHHLGGTRGGKVVAVVFLSTGCPISNGYIPRLNKLANEFTNREAEFYGVISATAITRANAAAHRKKYDVGFPVLFDASGELRQQLQPTHVPQAFVLDRHGAVVYSGLIDNWYAALGRKRTKVTRHYLHDALRAALRGRKPVVKTTKPIGCLVEDPDRPIKAGDVTYCRDIAPILEANCATCHREGEAAPFTLRSYEDATQRAKQIAAVTKSRFMPPWKPVKGFGHFRGERRLNEREISLIQAWVKGGKPKGDPDDLPPQRDFVQGWQLGKPDLILKMKQSFPIAADGPDVYRHFVLPVDLARGRLVAAMEFRPGNPRVVHHASVFFDNSGIARRLAAAADGYGYSRFGGPGFLPSGNLGNWVPGMVPHKLPQGMGQPMPRGCDVILQLHYQTVGKPETDRSTVGIYFADRSARQVVAGFHVLNTDLKIPAGASRFRHHASFTLPSDIILLDAAPHMHLLGREMKVTATLPDGTVKPLIWIKDWDFNWQGDYIFKEPIRLPRGTRIDVVGYLDNSKENPLNPSSPPRDVTWGEQTTDEMVVCHFRFTASRLRDLVIMNRHYAKYVRKHWENYQPSTRNGRSRN